jgi:hypothetical protein
MTYDDSLSVNQGENHQFELGLLKEEYFFIQKTVEDYNKQIWVIKALGITGTGAVVAFALHHQQCLVIVVGCAIPLFFWILESQWKHFQRGFYPRLAEIEDILKVSYGLKSPCIFGNWCSSFKRDTVSRHSSYLWDGLLNPSVFISYILEISFLLLLWQILR